MADDPSGCPQNGPQKEEISADAGETRKYNVSAYRVLFILLLLMRQRSLSLEDINRELIANASVGQAYNGETITKYVNTLRRVGCQIPRPNVRDAFQYALQRSPFPIPVSEAELAAAQRLLALLSALPDETLYLRYYQALCKIAWSLSEAHQTQLLCEPQEACREESLQRRRALAAKFRELCKDAQVLSITYASDAAEPLQLLVEPFQTLHENGRLYLMAYDRNHYEKIKLNLDKILEVRQLPLKCERRVRLTTVMFRLSGRLSKTYRPYKDETVRPDDAHPDTLLVRARTDDVPALLRRLFKYGDLCEVLSPADARRFMAERVARLLAALGPVTDVLPPDAPDEAD
ncbi:MAG: WYL domain-containing protein [Vampirovibrionales bacterium]|nr:WYL domain-containing protein [Vampirovibrionales bacterium]